DLGVDHPLSHDQHTLGRPAHDAVPVRGAQHANIASAVHFVRLDDGEIGLNGRDHPDRIPLAVGVVQLLPAVDFSQLTAVDAGAGLERNPVGGGPQAGGQRGASVFLELEPTRLDGFAV